jgi:hypothetical protein
MSTLCEGVHAGISPSCAVNPNALGTNLLESRFEVVLDAIAAGLTLPSGKRPAVVGDHEL